MCISHYLACEEPAMMVLAVSHNTGDPTPHLQAESARMAELQQAGLVELMLLKADWSGAPPIWRPRARQSAACRWSPTGSPASS
jgi:hypothetical protein